MGAGLDTAGKSHVELMFPFTTSNVWMDILEAGGQPHAGAAERL